MEQKVYKILLVDDEPGIAEGLKILLEAMDRPWRVVGTAGDGAEGLTLTELLRPDIIVTDVKMPVMDGLEMLRRLKETGCNAGVVVLSGYAEFEYARQAISLGVKAYVTKPVDENELEKAIAEICEQQAARKPSGAAPAAEAAQPEDRQDVIDRVKAYIRLHYTRDITLAELSEQFFLNPYYLSQLFKKKTGMTFQRYLTELRMDQARRYLTETDLKIYEISERIGYADTVYFSRIFEKRMGMRPSDYRKSQKENNP